MVTPRFTHDCDNPGCCIFLGQTLSCDVYMYRSILNENGILMRYSSDGPDNSTWPSLHYARMSQDSEVLQAVALAEEYLSKPS
jgi:hypothetical protein